MEAEYYEEMHRVEDIHWWFVGRRMILAAILERFFTGAVDGQILEVGCGSGGNLEWLSGYGELVALELDDRARELAGRREICRVEKGWLPDGIPFTEKFDLICLLDVLEHIDDDLAALRAVWERLKPGGLLLATVPAYPFLWSAHDEVNHHKRRYLKRGLAAQAAEAGLVVSYISYFNTFLFPLVALARGWNNLRGRAGVSDVSLPPASINRLLKTVFAAERRWLPKSSFPCGVSLVLVAGKN
jgi:SAM-dependent methyltransferase